MKQTVAIDSMKDVLVLDAGPTVEVHLRTYRVSAIQQPLTPDQAEAIANALLRCAAAARATLQARA